MAVVIQKMVQAEASGVLFSRHPLNGDPSVIVITANYGLGESVVAGKTDPDTFWVQKSYVDDLEILGTKVGQKKILVAMDNVGSVEDIEVDKDKQNKLCLSEETVLTLAKIGVIMEKFFGSPRDLEFATTNDGKIYLLQSRSITSLNNFTDFEILHENDSPVMSNTDVFTRANVGEIFLGPQSLFTQSFVTKTFNKMVFKTSDRDSHYSGLFSMSLPVRDNHLFMNVAVSLKVYE